MKHLIFSCLLVGQVVLASAAIADECDFIRVGLAALPDSGGELDIPAGTFNCESAIVLKQDHVALVGAGIDQTILRLADHRHAPLLVIGEDQSIQDTNGEWMPRRNVGFVKLSDLTLDGNLANHDPSKECGEGSCNGDPSSIRNNALTIRRAHDVEVERVVAHDSISGGIVTEKHCLNLHVQDYESFGNHFDGFAGYETEQSLFEGLRLHNNHGAGISLDLAFNNNTFQDSQILSNDDVGIFARDLVGNHFLRLNIQNSGNFGVFLSASDSGTATCPVNNIFDSVQIQFSKHAGFRLNSDCSGNAIVGESNLCDNAEGATSVAVPGTLVIQGSMLCQ